MIISELLQNLYSNESPYSSADLKYTDNGYPHTHINKELLNILFENIEPDYIVECGSMVGGSAIRMAELIKNLKKNNEIICIDPFIGDVNMWAWEKGGRAAGAWRFLNLENGIPTIYKRFLANCKNAGFENKILPINCTTSVGIKLLKVLFMEKRITSLPNYIYLDSAHEPDETYIELNMCYNLLTNKGILFGDDWAWGAVRNDVTKFAQTTIDNTDYESLIKIHNNLKESQIVNNNIILYKGHWVLFKK